MVSPELLRRYPFFAGLSMDQLVALAKLADELEVEPGYYFFREEETLNAFYLVLEGKVDITFGLLAQGSRTPIHEIAEKQRELTVSTVVQGEVFAWSALVPPYHATSNGKALSACKVVAFDCTTLRTTLEQDTGFGYTMMVKIAQIARDRLHDMHNESLAYTTG